jgi:tRNA(His) guanylyltransferase
MKDDLGDRMKKYERHWTGLKLDEKYTYARLDGRGFSKLTKNLDRPFDSGFSSLMSIVTKTLVQKTHAIAGYTQSDEISLAWETSKVFFDGKVQKLSSILASLATSIFVNEGSEYTDINFNNYPHFDGRVFCLNDENELINAFLWRYKDCHRNAIQSIGQSFFSQKELNRVSMRDLQFKLAEIGVNPDDYPSNNIHGTFFIKEDEMRLTDAGLIPRSVVIRKVSDWSKTTHSERLEFILGEQVN